MSTATITLGPISTRGKDLDDAAMVAARAFHNDPFFEYLDPRGVRRARGLALFWRATIAGGGPKAIATGARTADGRLVGLSIVMPPGAYPTPATGQVRQMVGAFRAMVVRPPGAVSGLRYLLAVEHVHPKDELWYLELLVVDPSAQRTGIGARLQQDMLDQADSQGLDCYLETQKLENVAYYRRFGYEVVEELRPVPSGPPIWTMRRPVH